MKIKSQNRHDPEAPYWWVAINGPSAAASSLPLPSSGLSVSPVPEQLIGLPTQEEQMRLQRLCMEAPIAMLRREFTSGGVASMIKRGDWAYLVPQYPQPPSVEGTLWRCQKPKDRQLFAADGQNRIEARRIERR